MNGTRPAGPVERVATACQYLAAVVLLVAMAAITANSVARYLFGGGYGLVIELAGYAFVSIIFLGLGGTFLAGGHISVQVLDRLVATPLLRRLQGLAVAAVSLAFVGSVLAGAAITTWRFYQDGSRTNGVEQLPLWPIMLIVPLGCLILGAALLHNLRRYRSLESGGASGPPAPPLID